jgi:hypothetical protein
MPSGFRERSELHRQLQLAPEAVHLDPLSPYMKSSVEMWPGQPEPVKKRKEDLLEIAARKANRSTESLEAEAQIRVAAMTRMASKQGG